MAKVDDPVAFEGRFGFIVRQDNNSIAASFSFETKEDADAAHQKMKEQDVENDRTLAIFIARQEVERAHLEAER